MDLRRRDRAHGACAPAARAHPLAAARRGSGGRQLDHRSSEHPRGRRPHLGAPCYGRMDLRGVAVALTDRRRPRRRVPTARVVHRAVLRDRDLETQRTRRGAATDGDHRGRGAPAEPAVHHRCAVRVLRRDQRADAWRARPQRGRLRSLGDRWTAAAPASRRLRRAIRDLAPRSRRGPLAPVAPPPDRRRRLWIRPALSRLAVSPELLRVGAAPGHGG